LDVHELIRLLSSDIIQNYLLAHEFDDPKSLVLQKEIIHGVSVSYIAQQIEGRRKAKEKLPTWHQTPGVIYPPGLNLEQSSSEATAMYKTSVLADICTKRDLLIDLTGGFGIDSSGLSEKFERVIHLEPNEPLSAIAKHNHDLFGRKNIDHIVVTAEEFLASSTVTPDVFYIDPSRRNALHQKVFRLKDTAPDIITLLPQLLRDAEFVLVKTSPLQDLVQVQHELKYVHSIHVVAVNNECKEVLVLCHHNFQGEPMIHTVNLGNEKETFVFNLSSEQNASAELCEPRKFLYEPNAAILKAGAFKSVAERFHVFKLHPNTHFYTAENFISDFPGRIFEILSVMKSDPKDALRLFPQGRANVITRNYPLKPEELKRKLKLNDGGDGYVIGATSISKKVLLAARRLK
jgi:hypothetical protein